MASRVPPSRRTTNGSVVADDPAARHEAELMARVAAAEDDEPVRVLYDRYARRLYALGLRMMGDAGAAEDLVQETFVRVWRSAPSFDPERGTVRAFDRVLLGLELRAAMAELSAAHREVLELHYDEDLTQPQIAERIGVPLGTVKTRTFHALRALRARLKGDHVL